MRLTRLATFGTIFLGVALLATACSDSDDPAGPISLGPGDLALASLERLDTCDQVVDRLAVTVAEPHARLELQFGMGGDGATAARESADAVSAPAGSASGGQNADDSAAPVPVFSGTNVQEQGVDEPDTVKTDGEVLYVLRQGIVRVMRAGDLAELAVIDRPIGGEQDGHAANLLLGDDVLLVLGQAWRQLDQPIGSGGGASDAIGIAPPGTSTTVIARYDLSDPADPRLVERTEVDGDLINARLVGDQARVVVRHTPVSVTEPGEATEADLLPAFSTSDEEASTSSSGPAVDCDAVFAPAYETGPSTITVHTVDMADGYSPGEAVSVIAGGDIVYASTERLYVATTRWFGGVPMPLVGAAEPALVDPAVDPALDELVESGAVEILPEDTEPGGTEPGAPPVEPTPTEPPREIEPPQITTELHAFDITADGPASYLGSGQVRGTVLNQFSMSEHEGVFRVATTVPPTTGAEASESFVSTFRLEGDQLRQLGQVGGLGRTEQIYSVRFIGDVGYVVTFRQVDPLYTVDLSDPADPTVRGELKIEGYSAYLHPVDAGRLVGIGQDATAEGQRLGTQMSVFDVSDLDDPRRLSQIAFGGGSDSVAEHDHHAFLWWAPTDLFVVPLNVYGFDPQTGAPTSDAFSGAVLVRLDGDRLVEDGRISHPQDPRFFAGIDRSLVIGDLLYTVSESGVAAHSLDGFQQAAWQPFPVPGGGGGVEPGIPVPEPTPLPAPEG